MSDDKIIYSNASGSELDSDFLFRESKSYSLKFENELSSKNNLYYLYVLARRGNEIRRYDALVFLDCYKNYTFKDMNRNQTDIEQIDLLSELNFQLSNYIFLFKSHINSTMAEFYDYKFEELLIPINIALDGLKLRLESQKLHKENKHFIKPLVISGMSILLAFAAIFLPYIDKWFFNDKDDNIELQMQQLIEEVRTLKTDVPILSNENTDSPSEKSEATPLPAK